MAPLFFLILFAKNTTLIMKENDGEYPIFRNEYWRVIMNYH